jgi:CobQ-like glutamine amidotransferase family enzyme
VGEVISTCAIPGVGSLTGFENHRGITTLGPGMTALGRVVTGTGNGTTEPGTRHRTEGVLTEHIIGTYMHGPVLARNPALADHILHKITGQTLTPLELPDQAALRATYL